MLYAGGRCTDGCWLSIRRAEVGGHPVLMVYLDCEGLGSWERTENEDMLLALVSAAMASLTMFKTHFDFNRYTRRCSPSFPDLAQTCSSKMFGALMYCVVLGEV
jgi:hypothetical protein